MRVRILLFFLFSWVFSGNSIAEKKSHWSVCDELYAYSKGGGISEEKLSQWIHGLDRPYSVEMSAGKAVRIQVEASTTGLVEIGELTWGGINRAAGNLYSGAWRAFFMSVDIDNDGKKERVAIYRKAGAFGQAYAYVLTDDDRINPSYLGPGGRPLVVGGELFFYADKVYWLQIDPRFDEKAMGNVKAWRRFIRIYRSEVGGGLPFLVHGVHGGLCEINIKEGG
ncbi:hypothetical protein [Metapseudomonas otitidis]|uniref:hypothetical protein n=1 Tax=Metapseudomonas otitidis TaxID=319939 RepID=UPI0013F69C59|nr:hypothetical protein [Pseudomonas otitidis]